MCAHLSFLYSLRAVEATYLSRRKTQFWACIQEPLIKSALSVALDSRQCIEREDQFPLFACSVLCADVWNMTSCVFIPPMLASHCRRGALCNFWDV
jgi:hypothetical protein